jgi:hypothetical protein
MTVRRPEAGGNPPDARKSELSDSTSRRTLLSVREALILLAGLLIGVAAGVLDYAVVHNVAQSVLVGIPACVGSIKFLDSFIA